MGAFWAPSLRPYYVLLLVLVYLSKNTVSYYYGSFVDCVVCACESERERGSQWKVRRGCRASGSSRVYDGESLSLLQPSNMAALDIVELRRARKSYP